MSKGLAGFGLHLLTVILFVGAAVAMALLILVKRGTVPTPGPKYRVTTTVPTASLLSSGARVTMAGADVGRVKSVERADETGPGAKVTSSSPTSVSSRCRETPVCRSGFAARSVRTTWRSRSAPTL